MPGVVWADSSEQAERCPGGRRHFLRLGRAKPQCGKEKDGPGATLGRSPDWRR